MNSELFKVNAPDFLRAGINAVLIAALATVYGVATAVGFDLFTANWPAILQDAINASFIAFITVLGNSFITDEYGQLFGKIG